MLSFFKTILIVFKWLSVPIFYRYYKRENQNLSDFQGLCVCLLLTYASLANNLSAYSSFLSSSRLHTINMIVCISNHVDTFVNIGCHTIFYLFVCSPFLLSFSLSPYEHFCCQGLFHQMSQ